MTDPTALRVLILCTGNSARSQIAEALLATRGRGRIVAASAGVEPAGRVNPLAEVVLAEAGIEWSGRRPRSVDDVIGEPWDLVITVCDHARESCPVFPGRTLCAHWGMPDPAAIAGSDGERLDAFRAAFAVLSGRVDRLLALPLETMDDAARRTRIDAIGVEP